MRAHTCAHTNTHTLSLSLSLSLSHTHTHTHTHTHRNTSITLRHHLTTLHMNKHSKQNSFASTTKYTPHTYRKICQRVSTVTHRAAHFTPGACLRMRKSYMNRARDCAIKVSMGVGRDLLCGAAAPLDPGRENIDSVQSVLMSVECSRSGRRDTGRVRGRDRGLDLWGPLGWWTLGWWTPGVVDPWGGRPWGGEPRGGGPWGTPCKACTE